MAKRTSEQTTLRLPDIAEQLRVERHASLPRLLDESEPVDLAAASASLDDAELRSFVELLPSARLAALVGAADGELRRRVTDILDDGPLLVTLGHLPDDEAADVMGALDPARMGRLLAGMRPADRAVLASLLQYPAESAGSLMTTSFLAIGADRSVADCLALIRAKAADIEQIQTVYVLGADGTLEGSLDLRRILSSPRATPTGAIMDAHVVCVDPYADQEEAARLVARYDLNALPVVSGGQLLGVITVDDVIDVIVKEYDEDLLRLAGANREETLASPLRDSVRMRLPWLLVNLATAFAASLVVRLFEGTIEQVVALSAIMTIVSGMGGNAGSQTMAIVVRQLSKGEVAAAELRRALCKEIAAGAIDGLANGLVTGAVVLALYRNPWLSLVVLAAMVGNMVIAGSFGLLVPVAIRACGQDPAVASSIFVTTATDVLGFLLFLGLAQLLLPLLA